MIFVDSRNNDAELYISHISSDDAAILRTAGFEYLRDGENLDGETVEIWKKKPLSVGDIVCGEFDINAYIAIYDGDNDGWHRKENVLWEGYGGRISEIPSDVLKGVITYMTTDRDAIIFEIVPKNENNKGILGV